MDRPPPHASPVASLESGRRSGRVEILDSLRGVAALSTLLFHFHEYPFFPDWMRRVFSHGFGTSASFVISGYIICYVLWKNDYRFSFPDAARFLARRLGRVEPLYFLAIALALTLMFINTLSPAYRGPAFALDVIRLALNVTYLNAFTGSPWIVHVGWILAVELQFYVTIAVAFGLLVSASPTRRACGALLFLLPPFFLGSLRENAVALGCAYGHFFAYGILAFQFRAGFLRKTDFFFALTLTSVAVATFISAEHMAVGLAVTLPTLFYRGSERITAFVGRMSYSVFLFHLPVGFQVLARSQKWLGDTNPANLIALLGSVLLASWVLHHAVELPLQNRSARIAYGKRRRSRPAAETPNLQLTVEEVGGARA